MFERARATLVNGVASSYQLREPWPIYLDRGEGQGVWDVDGNRLRDFHNAFGSMVQGHAHPAIGAANRDPVRRAARRPVNLVAGPLLGGFRGCGADR